MHIEPAAIVPAEVTPSNVSLSNALPALLAAGWREDAPVLVVHKASWPGEEKVVRGTLADIRERCRAEKIASQAMIIVSPTLGARQWPELKRSKLYDSSFTHRFRKGVKAAQ